MTQLESHCLKFGEECNPLKCEDQPRSRRSSDCHRERPLKRQVEKEKDGCRTERPVKRQSEKKTSDDDKKNVGNVCEPREWMDDVDHLVGCSEKCQHV